MLANFFKLDGAFKTFDATQLVAHFDTSCDLRSVMYKPDDWPADLRKLKSCKFTNVSLSKTKLVGLTFTECEFIDCLFIGANFVETEFHRCKFVNCNFYKASLSECYIDPATVVFDSAYRKMAANIGVHIYQQLFANASNTLQASFAQKADFEFRRWKRWQLKYDLKIGKISQLDRARDWVASFVYEWIAGFGYRPWRYVCATVAFFTIMSFVNMRILPGKLTVNGVQSGEVTFADSVFYTYSIMTVLGFSSIVPATSLAKILAVVEALLGVGWLGVFTSVLVRRFIK